jgi:hypothetical protein
MLGNPMLNPLSLAYGPIVASDLAIKGLGNALLQSAHALAFCREHKLYYVNFPFAPYARNFATARYSVLCSAPSFPWFPISPQARKPLRGLARRLHAALGSPGRVRTIEIEWTEEVRMDEAAFMELVGGEWLVALRGWRFRAPLLVKKHARALRQYFRPIAAIRRHVRQKLVACRSASDVVIGLHVRLGDYRKFLGGRFFYPEEAYVQIAKHVLTLFPGQRVHFFVCSDCEPELLRCSALPVAFSVGAQGTPVEDLYALAGCDYLIGPPSTFSLWASFYGQVPIFHIESVDARPARTDFRASDDLVWKYDDACILF